MKIRTDFVTNSSSSSFILGRPGGDTIDVSKCKKYLKNLKDKLNLQDDINAEFIIDLKYDSSKIYEVEEVDFVSETLLWYLDEIKDEIRGDSRVVFDYWEGDSLVTEYGEFLVLDEYRQSYLPSEVKVLYDVAYQYLGEIIVGNSEIGFWPMEYYDMEISTNKDIRFKSNHMG